MAETERPHRSSSINSSSNNNNNASSSSSSTDLFICFTSRFSSSSSMRLSSKSIHSPARSACLTTSLSRRLRTSGSLKNASAGVLNSPMFGANNSGGGRKRSGSGYENSNNNNNNNIEPSSPKVTCIGQVRVKTRKHVKKKMRARSRRKGGETSFRRSADQNDGGSGSGSGGGGCRFDATENRWVHLPVTICESLRSFGSELNCFFPCRSSCMENSHGDGRRRVESNNEGCGGGGGKSCGAVFTRWFVAVEETSSGGKRREIELVVGGEDEVEEDRRRSRRRHVFEGLDLSEIEMKTEKKERGEVGRMSICSPPKNALLLMRCRSDPVKVAALANRVRERQLSLNDGVYRGGREEEEDDERRRKFELEIEDKKRIDLCDKWISGETNVEREEAEAEAEVVPLVSNPVTEEEERVQVLEDSIVEAQEEGSKSLEVDSYEEEEIEATILKNIEDDIRNAIEEEEHMAEMVDEEELAAVAEVEEEEEEEESKEVEEEEEEEESKEVADAVSVTRENEERSEQGNREPDPSPEVVMRGGSQLEKTTATPYKVLPDCLLLMMCEPKLSMEVSKETWVCSTDFVRCLPGRPPAKKIPPEATGDNNNNNHHHQQPKKRIVAAVDSNASSRRRSIDKPPLHLQPPRSSCSYPAAPPIITAAAAVGEQKVAGANKAYEPPVLPRCKSEPRKSASKLAPEACFWKNRKLEPHPQASVGVGAAGVGF
ncbi:PREDICTED: serine/threonine-protein kinase pakA-like [Camelina sativa]|uniref:Serine/threonine-protein kinase pakA-like n=1 Tax=Camelina sativa TaxID=90675 RepID=A0ABM0YKP4_CAMSA|nr:PREDICTED: serine/threonine-protein kinase pakA-like [Camelina sativa]